MTWTDPSRALRCVTHWRRARSRTSCWSRRSLAAAALAQVVGNSVGYAQTGLLFVEPDTATLALVNTADGSITDVHRQPLTPGSDPIAELSAMASGAEALETRPDGLFIVGSGVDIAPIKPHLEAATGLTVNAPEEPERRWPGRGTGLGQCTVVLLVDCCAGLRPRSRHRFDRPIRRGSRVFRRRRRRRIRRASPAYSAVGDEDADAYTALADEHQFPTGSYTGITTVIPRDGGRRPLFLVVERGRGDFRGRRRGTGGRAGDQYAADGGRPARTGPQCGRPGEAGARRTRSPSSAAVPAPAPAPAPRLPLRRPQRLLPRLRPQNLRHPRRLRPPRLQNRRLRLLHRPARAGAGPVVPAPVPIPIPIPIGPGSGPGATADIPAAADTRVVADTPAAGDTPAAEATPEVATAASGRSRRLWLAEATAASATDLAMPGLGF